MFSILQKIGFGQTVKVESIPCSEPEPIERKPIFMPALSAETPPLTEFEPYSCLDDIFGEMTEEQHPLSLSKW